MGNPQAHCYLCKKTKGMVNMEDIQKHYEYSPSVCKKENEAVDRIKTVERNMGENDKSISDTYLNLPTYHKH